jgi:hypothetical protein
MSQKNTMYQYQLSTIPANLNPQIIKMNTQDSKQKIAQLILLDMLQLLKM